MIPANLFAINSVNIETICLAYYDKGVKVEESLNRLKLGDPFLYTLLENHESEFTPSKTLTLINELLKKGESEIEITDDQGDKLKLTAKVYEFCGHKDDDEWVDVAY